MPFSIETMKGALVYGGARPNLFEVFITNPTIGLAADDKFRFMCHAASLPASTLTHSIINYFGRQWNIPQVQTYGTWDVTIYNDEDFLIKNGLEYWVNVINSHEGNLRAPGRSNPSSVKSDAIVFQYGKEGTIIKKVNLIGCFPSLIGDVKLSWAGGGGEAIEEFGVTFTYDYWETAEIL